MRLRETICVVALAALLCPVSASAEKYVVDLGGSEVTTVSAATTGLGDYYVLQFQLPAIAASELRYAILEVFVDVSSREVTGYTEGAPMLEVYGLSAELTGALNPTLFAEQTVPAVRHVPTGNARRVVIDITELVRRWLTTPATNHGLVMGSLTGTRPGLFTLRNDKLGGTTKVRIAMFD